MSNATKTLVLATAVASAVAAVDDVKCFGVSLAPKPVMQAEAVLITRARFDPEIHAINTAAAACVSALQKGQSLGQAMATADNTLDLGAILGLLLAQGAVTEIY
jgi:hypothetical protein